jgi:hypothetical protein
MATFNVTQIARAIVDHMDFGEHPRDVEAIKRIIRANVDGCLANCQDDEPIFVLVARDQTAPETVDDWIDRAAARGVPSEKLAGAKAIASQMDDWQERHGAKVPD